LNLEIDIEGNLETYLPSIFSLLDKEKINWIKISKQYQKELEYRKNKLFHLGEKEIVVEACLFDVITQVLKGHSKYLDLLRFFNEIFLNLKKKTSVEEKKLLKTTIYNLLINVDKNYLNFIGEMAILNNLKNDGYILVAIEYPLNAESDNSKSVDFIIQKGEKYTAIEVMNIHLPIIEEFNDVERSVTQKIRNKLNTKQKGAKYQFILAPVLWGEYNVLKLINQYYEKNEFPFNDVLFPMAYQSYLKKDRKESRFIFGSIKKLILQ